MPVLDVVSVLDADNCKFFRPLDFLDVTFDNPTVLNFSGVLCGFQRAERFFIGTLRSTCAIDTRRPGSSFNPLQTFIDALRQIFRTTIRHPIVRARPGQPAFGRITTPSDRMERFRDEKLARFWTVSVGPCRSSTPRSTAPARLSLVLAIGRPTPVPRPLCRIAPKPTDSRKIAADWKVDFIFESSCEASF